MAHATQLVTGGKLVQEMQRCIWRDEARHALIAEGDIERSVFLRWLLERRGGVTAVVYEPVKRAGRW